MRLSAPKMVTWVVAFVLGLLGALAYFFPIAVITPYAIWFVVIALVIMLLATATEGL